MLLTAPIQTPRLTLRTLGTADANTRYLSWMKDPEILRYLEARLGQHSLRSLGEFIEGCNSSSADLLLGICLKSGGHIGNIKLGPINTFHQHASVGLLIGERSAWGQGYAAEAIAGLTRYAFEQLKLEKLYAGCYASNLGSLKAFLRAGYAEEGRSRAMWRCGDIREDNVTMGAYRPDWLAKAR